MSFRLGLLGLCLLVACSGSGQSVASFCNQIDAMQSIDERLAGVDLSDSDAVAAALTSFRQAFANLANASPNDIADDAQTVANFGIALSEAAQLADPDDSFDRAALLAAAAATEPDVDEAFDRLATYAARNCASAPAG